MRRTMFEMLKQYGVTAFCVVSVLVAAPVQGVEKASLPEGAEVAEKTTESATEAVEPAAAPGEAAAKESHDIASAVSRALGGPHRGSASGEIVEFGRAVELKAGETANDVVVIGGSARVDGKVRDTVVAIGGNVILNGEVDGDIVTVMGSISLGTNASVRGDTVAVLGRIDLASGASVRGDSIAVGGRVECPDGASIDGEKVGVTLPGFGWLSEMGGWVSECVFKLRPLSFKVGWVWVVAGMFLLLYLLVALAFPRPVEACVSELSRRPATTLLMGLLTKILLPVIHIILLVTGIGVFIVPFLSAAVFVAGIVGKVALLVYFGRQLGRQFGASVLQQTLAAFLVGWTIVTLLYVVPVLGMVIYLVTGMWALGAAVMALFGGMRREMPERPAPPSGTPPSTYVPAAPTPTPASGMIAPLASLSVNMPEGEAQPSASPPVAEEQQAGAGAAAAVAAPPVAISHEASTLPRATFWERMGAGFLDVVLVSILGGIVGGPPWGFLVALAYFAGMWAWKGTTVGGIVLKLKVVRLDGQPVTFPVALVRGLAAGFSVIVFFLGFLWIAWDMDKQAWHDKIAGTVVVRLPQAQPLVCL